MNYDLAKQLKDAGFPQKTNNPPWGYWLDTGSEEHPIEKVYVPTLSELIEACIPERFDEFGLITGYTDKWEAFCENNSAREDDDIHLKTIGQTPEEAVANVWLELNKKDNI